MQEQAHRVVSSEDEQLILVDPNDMEIGHIDKLSAHDADGQLHRAFSLFIFDSEGRLLLQQRSASKRLWPNYWSNSCCSHPRRGESMQEATQRRLHDELNIAAELEFVYKFAYKASYGELGSEHELCWVYLGRTDDTVVANRNEIAETRSLTASDLGRELAESPESFTPWFRLEWEELNSQHEAVLRKYVDRGPGAG